MDSLLDWAMVVIPTIVGIAWPDLNDLTEKSMSRAKRRTLFITSGAIFSCLIFFQQYHARTEHAAEIASLSNDLKTLREGQGNALVAITETNHEVHAISKAVGISAMLKPPENKPPQLPLPKKFTSEIKEDQSRVVITNIQWNLKRDIVPWPFFTFFYHNLGKIPAHGITRSTEILTTSGELTADQLTEIQNELDIHEDYAQASKQTDFVELYPNDQMNHFWSMPDQPGANADALNTQLDDLNGGKKWLYLFFNLKWKDKTMAGNVIGTTEDCAYFAGNFLAWHQCGRKRSYLRELTAAKD
jgi:hypothetical protein